MPCEYGRGDNLGVKVSALVSSVVMLAECDKIVASEHCENYQRNGRRDWCPAGTVLIFLFIVTCHFH